jgi:hypothetical protein
LPVVAELVKTTDPPEQNVVDADVVIEGVAGVDNCAFTTTDVKLLIQPNAVFTLALYVPAATPVKIPVVLVYVVPSMLYVSVPTPVGVKVMIPVGTAQVGWVIVATGAVPFAG